MQPAFFGTYKTVDLPFGSRAIAQLPREHRLVKNGSFDDRFVEGTYLCSDSATPCIWMFSIAKNGSFGDRFVEGTYLYSDSATPTHFAPGCSA